MSIEKKSREYWTQMMQEIEKVAPKVWDNIEKEADPTAVDRVLYAGYYISPPTLLNYPPKIIVNAHLDLPESKETNPKLVNVLVENAAVEASNERLILNVAVQNNNPFMGSIENDKVFGTDPDIPHGMTYTLAADRGKFKEA